jgi:hypothetical protein
VIIVHSDQVDMDSYLLGRKHGLDEVQQALDAVVARHLADK